MTTVGGRPTNQQRAHYQPLYCFITVLCSGDLCVHYRRKNIDVPTASEDGRSFLKSLTPLPSTYRHTLPVELFSQTHTVRIYEQTTNQRTGCEAAQLASEWLIMPTCRQAIFICKVADACCWWHGHALATDRSQPWVTPKLVIEYETSLVFSKLGQTDLVFGNAIRVH